MKLLDNTLWKKHPWNMNNMVELISVDFLYSIRNKKSTVTTDLLDGTIVPEEKVWENIKKEGMVEPLLVRIGLNDKTIRLESGNHRIKLAKKEGYTHLPITCYIANEVIFSEGNGFHKYPAKNIIDFDTVYLPRCPYGYQVKLSDIIKEDYKNIVLKD